MVFEMTVRAWPAIFWKCPACCASARVSMVRVGSLEAVHCLAVWVESKRGWEGLLVIVSRLTARATTVRVCFAVFRKVPEDWVRASMETA